jgi:hypothetical protein|tara:strand:+ start:237 stop:545 length:309 start_codon:yes stop_codon:yes gene_type:complete
MIHNLIHIAIHKINPNATFTVIDNDTDKITWHDNTTPISKSDIEAKLAEVQAEYDAEEWKRNRQAEYPSVEECVHALLDGGDTLTKLQEDRQAVKTKYPKGA